MKNLFIIFLFFVNFIFAQKITVIDAKTAKVIANVTAANKNNSKHIISNNNGVIDLSQFSDFETVYLKHISYETYSDVKQKMCGFKTIQLFAKENDLESVFLSVSKSKVKRSRIAQEIATFTKKSIQKEAPQTTADLLANIPGIKVQKSQFGGGSPVLRGMEGNRVLLVIDGVRMNNAIYRKGHLQNSISVSPNMLDRTEIMFGPASVMYGSDALGGVIHYYTRTPKTNQKFTINPTFLARYATVNNEISLNAGFEIQTKKAAYFTSISRSEYGDLRMGKNRLHGYDSWDLQTEYSNNTTSYYNVNSIVNNKPHLQKNIGFNQLDFLQKIYIPLSNKSELIFNFQYSTSSNIPRFDKLMERKNGLLKFAEWHYGPQKRFLAAAQLKIKPNLKWLKKGQITWAFQNINESRIQRKFNSLKRNTRKENVKVSSLNADFSVPLSLKNNRILSYGTEFSYNKVNSVSKGETLTVQGNQITNLDTNFVVQTRYPDGGSNYFSTALYADYRQDISKKETLNTGVRLTSTKLHAKWNDTTFIALSNNNVSLSNTALTATIGYVLKPIKNLQLNAVLSTGFRSPNIDDIGKIREKNGYVSVPNTNLKPEYVYNGEIGFIKYFDHKKSNLYFTTYYTLLNNYITRELFSLNGNNTMLYDGEVVQTIANVNKKTAYIFGGTISYNGKLGDHFNTYFSATYTKGKAMDTGDPLSSIPPLFGKIGFGYQLKKWKTSLSLKFNAQKKISEYNSIEGIDNINQTPFNTSTNAYDIGSLAWQTVNYRLKYQVNKKINMRFHIDNVFDIHYKEFASSISAPGRNFSFSIMSNF